MRIRDRAPLPGALMAEQKYFKIVSRAGGKIGSCTSRAPPIWGGAPPHRRDGSATGENCGGFLDACAGAPHTDTRATIFTACGALRFESYAAPRRPDTVAPGRRAPMFPALATAPRRACARLPPSRSLAPDRPLSPVRAQHKPLMLQWAALSGCANCLII